MSSTPPLVVSLPGVVGAVLLATRKERSLSQAQLAEAVGLNVSTWSRVENGESALTIEQLAAAAAALETSPSAILGKAEEKLAELNSKGFATASSRAALAGITADGAIPFAGAALLGALGPVGLVAAGAVAGFMYFKGKKGSE